MMVFVTGLHIGLFALQQLSESVRVLMSVPGHNAKFMYLDVMVMPLPPASLQQSAFVKITSIGGN
jgi:hypothetical protein